MTRSQSSANGKRKRSPSPTPKVAFEGTPLTCLYVQGLDRDQIWAQLELRAQRICKMLEFALDGTEDPAERRITSNTDSSEQDPRQQEEGEEEDDDDSDSTFEGSDDDSEPDQEVDGSSDGQPSEEGVIGLRDHSIDEEDEELTEESHVPSSASPPRTKGGHFGLNDDFFDLEVFNAEAEEAEAGFVSNGALDADLDGVASDEDDIDYFASVDGQMQADGDHGRPIAPSTITPITKY